MVSSLDKKYNEHVDEFNGENVMASRVVSLMGRPDMLGSSLDQLKDPNDAISSLQMMPGAFQGQGKDTTQSSEYYMGYKDTNNMILWFKVATQGGDERIAAHGWQTTSGYH